MAKGSEQRRFERYELKYFIDDRDYDALRKLIDPYMELDEYLKKSGSESYVVRSLYLDTSDLQFYREQLAGQHTRKKFRIRGYGNNGEKVFLEIKRRINTVIIKDRAPILKEDMQSIIDLYGRYETDGKHSDKEREVIERFLFLIPCFQMRPTVLLAYDREAYTAGFDHSIRLTVDRRLRCVPGRFARDIFEPDHDWWYVDCNHILELKFNGELPFFFRYLIRSLNLNLTSISKYRMCLEKCGV